MHFLRDRLGDAPKDQHALLAVLIQPIFRPGSGEEARRRLGEAVAQLERPLPNVPFGRSLRLFLQFKHRGRVHAAAFTTPAGR